MKNNAEFMWLALQMCHLKPKQEGTMTAAWPFPTGAKPIMALHPETITAKPWPFPKSVDIDVTCPVWKFPPDIEPEAQVANAPFVDFRTNDGRRETDPNGKAQNEPGAKVDAGKIRPWLCLAGFSRALEEVSRVTTIGAVKYTPNGWAQVPDGSERYMDAFGRHFLAAGKGEIVDDGPNGTGCLHKAQMIWNLLASLELDLRKEENERN